MTPRTRFRLLAGFATTVLVGAAFGARTDGGSRDLRRARLPEQYRPTTVLMLNYGSDDADIAVVLDEPDQPPKGPESFAIDHGNFLVLDTQNREVKRFSSGGQVLASFQVGRATDIAPTADGFVIALPETASAALLRNDNLTPITPKIAIERFSLDAQRRATFSLHEAKSEGANDDAAVPNRYEVAVVGEHSGVVRDLTTGRAISVETLARFGSIEFLGTDAKDNVFVAVQELLPNGTPDVRETIRKFSADGELRAQFQLPVDQAAVPTRDLVLDADGSVYYMRPLRTHLVIDKWQTN
jgi:hypothetical protein